MRGLNKRDRRRRDALAVELDEAVANINAAIAAYNGVLERVREFRDAIVERVDDYVGERSDGWHEGAAADAIWRWRDEWEMLDADEIEEPEQEHASALRELPTKPE